MIDRIVVSIGMSLLVAGTVYAQCRSESAERYQSEIASCNAKYAEPDDAAELRVCVESAYAEFAESRDECGDAATVQDGWRQQLAQLWKGLTEWLDGSPSDSSHGN